MQTDQNVTNEAKEQDQSQQQERQAKGDPQHSSSATHAHTHTQADYSDPPVTTWPSASPPREIDVMKLLLCSTSDLRHTDCSAAQCDVGFGHLFSYSLTLPCHTTLDATSKCYDNQNKGRGR